MVWQLHTRSRRSRLGRPRGVETGHNRVDRLCEAGAPRASAFVPPKTPGGYETEDGPKAQTQTGRAPGLGLTAPREAVRGPPRDCGVQRPWAGVDTSGKLCPQPPPGTAPCTEPGSGPLAPPVPADVAAREPSPRPTPQRSPQPPSRLVRLGAGVLVPTDPGSSSLPGKLDPRDRTRKQANEPRSTRPRGGGLRRGDTLVRRGCEPPERQPQG